MWICEKHKSENKEALASFKNEYQKNHELVLGLFATQIQVSAPISCKKRKVSTITETSVSKKSKSSMLKASEREEKEDTSKPACEHKSISTKEGTRKLKKKLSSSGEAVEVRPIPAGKYIRYICYITLYI